ncbi:homocysteine methyltransferase 2 [Actinidia rufa]|uniref:Homocysteine methyltransferase 2 n=1 Tax=Actinidia rufa TaxID=165716 RepID=A0A7J0FJR1_9ERIC|nr:homocysteine methyltransferase 2 [Actinidia rufa]
MGSGNVEAPISLMSDFLRQCGGVAVIDGGLATELERNGADLNDPLWSAKCLLTSPHLIRKVHLDYLEAGSDIIITASYQATIQGLWPKAFLKERVKPCLKEVWKLPLSHEIYIMENVVNVSVMELVMCQISLKLRLLLSFLRKKDIKIPAWFAFNSKDGINVVSGDSLLECAAIAEACKRVIAVGINCTPPRFIHNLILSVKKVTTKPILIYPNSGESYDPDRKEWVQNTGVSDEDFVSYVNTWCEAGASLVGGCCRTTPNTIRAIHTTLVNKSNSPSLKLSL